MEMLLTSFKFIGVILEVLLIFNLIIIVHELGHFIAAKLTDLAPSERAQVLQSEGITPAPPEELQAEEQKKAAAKAAEAALKRPTNENGNRPSQSERTAATQGGS